VALSLKQHSHDCQHLIVCGGGAFNTQLIQAISLEISPIPLSLSSEYGLNPSDIEGAAFAWLARQHCLKLTGNIPTVTGASHPVILGACFPA